MSTEAITPWTEDMLNDLEKVKRSTIRQMTILGRRHDAEDIAQETFIVATRRLDTFDPAKGTFQAWLSGIANNLVKRGGRTAGREAPVGGFQADEVHPYAPVAADISEDVTEQIFSAEKLARIMGLVYQAAENGFMVDRAVTLVREYDGDVKQAAEVLGVTPATMRNSLRVVQDLAQLVDNSLGVYWDRVAAGRLGQPLTVREILECFPSSDEVERQWLRVIPLAVLRAGGWNVPASELITAVSEMTGYTPNTARIYIGRAERLYCVARSLAETGSLNPQPGQKLIS